MRQQSVRSLSASPEEKVIPPPTPDNQPKHYPEHIKSIVDQIAGLTLIEVADLNQLLKERLNIQDAPVMSMGAVAAPVDQEEEDEAEKPREKTSFTVKLVKFDETQKIKLIKEIKSLNTGMNLVQAKKFVESLPQMVKADIGKDEASKLKEQLETVGGNCEIE
ncbi:putative 39S ribosomal protein L12, mitochondrial isoform X1 [Apostichopus japonicus]|uniref:Putative 39S ribosomal protein L12, mitochondrial isoform X1 n=1 Tax=Stichopus japonicus TaxID=307972 RepID=A0A2G8L708_STIJA|nr:putative 39S ribosomal protein L12, mitochondrial isoform X1 [Apostichopus japonicus]